MNQVQKLKESSGNLRFFSLDEIRLLIQKANPYIERFIHVGLMTGLRHGEILNIKLEHIDLKNNLIHIFNNSEFETKNRKNKQTSENKEERIC